MSGTTYEIRFFIPNNTLSLLMRAVCADDNDARIEARKLFASEFSRFEIWNSTECVASEDRAQAAA